MRTKWGQALFLLLGLALLTSTRLEAQAVTEVRGQSQTDVAASIFGTVNQTPTGNGITENLFNAAGGLLEVRHISKPWLGYEATYSYNRANQSYYSAFISRALLVPSCGEGYIFTSTSSVSANAHELTGDWIASRRMGKLRPFALAGGGILVEVPTSGQVTATTVNNGGELPPGTTTTNAVRTTTITTPVFVYGAGADWKLLPHIGLRFQYRGNLYHAPNLLGGSSTGVLTHTAEPMVGVYFRL